MASNPTQMAVIAGRNGSYGLVGPVGHVRHLAFGDGTHARCSMGPKQSLERVFFSRKSPCRRGVERHVLVLQCHPSGCNLWLEWFVGINGTNGTCQTSRYGDEGHDKPSQMVAGGGPFCRKISMLEGDSVAACGIHSHPSDSIFRL